MTSIALNPLADLLYSLASRELDDRGYTENAGYILALSLDNVSDVAYDDQPSCFVGTIESCCCDMDYLTEAERTLLRAIGEICYARYVAARAVA